jgi:hypothetical protein
MNENDRGIVIYSGNTAIPLASNLLARPRNRNLGVVPPLMTSCSMVP